MEFDEAPIIRPGDKVCPIAELICLRIIVPFICQKRENGENEQLPDWKMD